MCIYTHTQHGTAQQSLSLSLSLSLPMFVCIKECEVALTHFRICFLLCDTWVVSAQASERARIKHSKSNKSCWLMFISVCVYVCVCIVWIRLRECIKFSECLCWQSYSTLLIVCMRFSLFFQFRIPFVHFLLNCPFMLLWPVSFPFTITHSSYYMK